MKKKKKKLPTLASLKRKADTAFSVYIRTQDIDRNGTTECITCGVRRRWQDMQAGHFISRSYLSTRFDPRNCHVQCPGCNGPAQGRIPEQVVYLESIYGAGIVQMLLYKRRETIKFSRTDYIEMIERFNKGAEENLNGN